MILKKYFDKASNEMGVTDHSDLFLHFLYTTKDIQRKNNMAGKNRTQHRQSKYTPVDTTPKVKKCAEAGEKRCEDGSCIIARVELCPEEKLMNQNTILIMIVVGLAVVVFLVILYCFQQRQRRANREFGIDTGLTDECDNASLYAPPPAYEEVVSTDLYPATPDQRRLHQLSMEEPMTPPPNYDAALVILAQSQDSVFSKPHRQSSVFRRSVSHEHVNQSQNRRSVSPADTVNDSSLLDARKESKQFKKIFRFSRTISRMSATSNGHPNSNLSPSPCQSPRLLGSPPPYPQTSPIYPQSPPPPLTPISLNSQPQFSIQQPATDTEVLS